MFNVCIEASTHTVHCIILQMIQLPGVYVTLSCGFSDVFSVALLSAGSGTANTDDDAAGCDVTAGPPDSSSLGSSCNRTNPMPSQLLSFIMYKLPIMYGRNSNTLSVCKISGSHSGAE